MRLNKKLDIDKYIKTKTVAYEMAKIGNIDQKVQYIESLDFKDPEEATIYISTMLYPNDLEIIPEVYKRQSMEELSRKLNLPIKVIQLKAREYATYKLPELLKNHPILNGSCKNQTNSTTTESIDEIVNSKLK